MGYSCEPSFIHYSESYLGLLACMFKIIEINKNVAIRSKPD